MPELPEVETVKKGLEDILVNKTIKGINLSGFSLRFPIPKKFSILSIRKKNSINRQKIKIHII
jgi:formamidopyrimidine-DNA glycosylase